MLKLTFDTTDEVKLVSSEVVELTQAELMDATLLDQEVDEMEKIIDAHSIFSAPLEIIWRVYDRFSSKCKHGSEALGLWAVFQLGHIYGQRAERKRKQSRGIVA